MSSRTWRLCHNYQKSIKSHHTGESRYPELTHNIAFRVWARNDSFTFVISNECEKSFQPEFQDFSSPTRLEMTFLCDVDPDCDPGQICRLSPTGNGFRVEARNNFDFTTSRPGPRSGTHWQGVPYKVMQRRQPKHLFPGKNQKWITCLGDE